MNISDQLSNKPMEHVIPEDVIRRFEDTWTHVEVLSEKRRGKHNVTIVHSLPDIGMYAEEVTRQLKIALACGGTVEPRKDGRKSILLQWNFRTHGSQLLTELDRALRATTIPPDWFKV